MEQLLVLLDELIESALDQLYKQDIYLLEHEVHERTIVFRFGHYLQNLMDETEAFRDNYLDFEYNRNGNQPKRIPARSQNGALPDLIIHQRGTNAHNLLIMEFKTPWNRQIEDDCKKLRQFIDPHGYYCYLSGKSILLGQVRQTVGIMTLFSPAYKQRAEAKYHH